MKKNISEYSQTKKKDYKSIQIGNKKLQLYTKIDPQNMFEYLPSIWNSQSENNKYD